MVLIAHIITIMQDNDVNKINDISQRMFFLEHDFDYTHKCRSH